MKVFVTRKIPGSGIEMMKKAGLKVFVSKKDAVLTKKELKEELEKRKPDALLCLLTDKIDEEILSSAPIKICATYSVGFNHIDLAAAKKLGVLVTHTPGVLTQAVAEFTASLIFALSKRVCEADKFTRKGKYKGWEPELLLGAELRGKVLGILGAGRIGTRVAEILSAVGMKVIYSDIAPNPALEKMGVPYESKNSLLKRADVLSIHVPLLESTRHLISKKEFQMMKNEALLINTSRGPVVDEKELVKALLKGEIAGAALDVFENEPKFEPELAKMDNVIITPHIASATREARYKMSEMASQSIIDFAKGKRPQNVVST